MSHWNYRVIHFQHEIPNSPAVNDEFSICEVYYNDDETIYAISDGMAPYGENLKELKRNAETMLEAFKAPVLKRWEIQFVDYNPPEEGWDEQ